MKASEQNEAGIQPRTLQVTYSFPKAYRKILGVCPFIDGSCALAVIEQNYSESILYFKNPSNGEKQTKRFSQKDWNIFNFASFSQNYVIWFDFQNNYIFQWNLCEDEPIKIYFQFSLQRCSNHLLYIFQDTKHMCIAEKGKILKLTYFDLPINKQSVPVASHQINESQWDRSYHIAKGNTSSMVIWFKRSCPVDSLDIQFWVCTISNQLKNQIQITSHRIKQDQKNIVVSNIWENKVDNFTIAIVGETEIKGLKLYPTQLYVYEDNKKFNKDNQFYKSNVLAGKKLQNQIIHTFSTGRFAVVITFTPNQDMFPLPIYIIDNRAGETIIQKKYHPKKILKYIIPSYDKSIYVEAEYQNVNPKQIKLWLNYIPSKEEVTAYMLLINKSLFKAKTSEEKEKQLKQVFSDTNKQEKEQKQQKEQKQEKQQKQEKEQKQQKQEKQQKQDKISDLVQLDEDLIEQVINITFT